MTLSRGDTLLNGQYRILRQIGRGGFGRVYHARDTLIDSDVAIKELIPALVADEATLKRFLAEARATTKLRHDRIVGTHNIFQEAGNYYIVMEYMPGGSLEDLLRTPGHLEPEQATHVAAQVCEALTYAHERGVVHCDIKPANILFDAQGNAKLADFGIAHVSAQMNTRTWQTADGFIAGTLPYMSPEQTEGVRDDPRIDVYSLGAVLYRALTGQAYLGFDQRDTPRAEAENILLIVHQNPALPSSQNPGIPAWLDEIVMKALAKEPENRYPSAVALGAALLEPPTRVAARTQPTPVPLAPGTVVRASAAEPPAPASTRRGWLWPILAIFALLVLGSLLALVLRGNGSRSTEPPGPTSTQNVAIVSSPTLRLTPSLPAQTVETPALEPTTALPAFTLVPSSTPMPSMPPAPTTTPPPTVSPTFVATGTEPPTPTEPATARPAPTSPEPTAVETPAPAADKYPAPALENPVEGQVFSLGEEIVLRWQPVGELEANEHYQVIVTFTPPTHPEQTWTDEIPWTKDTQWALSEHSYLPELSADDLFRWSVQVMLRTGQDAQGKPVGLPLSPASMPRTLTWKPRDDGAGQKGTATPVPP